MDDDRASEATRMTSSVTVRLLQIDLQEIIIRRLLPIDHPQPSVCPPRLQPG